MASSYNEISFSRTDESKPVKEIHFDESFNDFTDADTGLMILNLEEFISNTLKDQKSIQILKIKSMS